MKNNIIILTGTALFLIVINYSFFRREATLASGDVILLDLAPRDVRSLVQGPDNSMQLSYTIAFRQEGRDLPADGFFVIAKDSNSEAQFVRIFDGGALSSGEKLLRYRRRGGRIRLAAPSFHYNQGDAALLERARFGELRLDSSGDAILTGIRDEKYGSLLEIKAQ